MGRTLQGYKALFDSLKKSQPPSVYFLYGPEQYIKREFVNEVVKRVLSDNDRAFNLDVLYGDEFERDTFHDRMSSFPLFASQRVIVIRKFEALALANKDFVIEHIENGLPSGVILVLESIGEKLDSARLKKIDKLARETGVSHKFSLLSDAETTERVIGRLRRDSIGIEPDAVDLLVGSVGTNLADVLNEADKIALCVEEGGVVTASTVAAVVGRYRTENVFSFLDDLGARDVSGVVRRMNGVIDSGEEPIFVLAMLMRRVLQMMQVKSLLAVHGSAARNPRTLAGRMSGFVSPFMAGKLLDQSDRFDGDILDTHLDNLRWADAKLKSTSLPARGVLETAVIAAATGKSLVRPAFYG